jgi:hypothetical protein
MGYSSCRCTGCLCSESAAITALLPIDRDHKDREGSIQNSFSAGFLDKLKELDSFPPFGWVIVILNLLPENNPVLILEEVFRLQLSAQKMLCANY